jgi:hypothetical protein
MLLQQLDVSCGEWLACWSLFFRFGHFVSPQMGTTQHVLSGQQASGGTIARFDLKRGKAMMPQLRTMP